MRFVVFVRANKDTEAGILPTGDQLDEMGKFNEGLVKDGVMLLVAEGLHPSSKGARIRFSEGRSSITDGPFAETKELVCGFWMVQAKSKEEVLERFSHAPFEDGEIEIRPVYELEEFGDRVSPEARERETRMREGMR